MFYSPLKNLFILIVFLFATNLARAAEDVEGIQNSSSMLGRVVKMEESPSSSHRFVRRTGGSLCWQITKFLGVAYLAIVGTGESSYGKADLSNQEGTSVDSIHSLEGVEGHSSSWGLFPMAAASEIRGEDRGYIWTHSEAREEESSFMSLRGKGLSAGSSQLTLIPQGHEEGQVNHEEMRLRGSGHSRVAPTTADEEGSSEIAPPDRLYDICPRKLEENPIYSSLVFEGGGVKGALSAEILNRIISKIPGTDASSSAAAAAVEPGGTLPCQHFDLIAGTSTGSLLALANAVPCHYKLDLETGKPVEYATALTDSDEVHKYCKQFLDPEYTEYLSGRCATCAASPQRRYHTRFGLGPYPSNMLVPLYKGLSSKVFSKYTLGYRTRSFYSPRFGRTPLDRMLKQYFGKFKFKHLVREVIVPAIRIRDNEVIYFSNRNTPDLKIRHAAAASSAAQTFFRPASFEYEGEETLFVDGGIVDNLPVMPVISMMLISNGGRLPPNYVLLAIGTGRDHRTRNYGPHAGLASVTPKVIDQAIEGKVSISKQLITSLDNEITEGVPRIGASGSSQRTFFLLPEFPKLSTLERGDKLKSPKIPMENPKVVNRLVEFAGEYVEVNTETIDILVERIKSVDEIRVESDAAGAAEDESDGDA